MNALVPMNNLQPSFSMVPQSMSEAFELARMMSDCGLLPESFRGKPGNALMVVEQAIRWKMSVYGLAAEVSVIQGKPMYSGKAVAAAIQSMPGVLTGRLHYDYAGEGNDRAITVSGTMVGETKPRSVTVRLVDAKTQNKNWVSQPDQQLAYHGARVWARRYAPEVLLGVWSPEEFEPSQPADTFMGTTVTIDTKPSENPTAPPPSPIDTIRVRLAACTDQECVTRVGDAWRKTVTRAADAGKAFSDVMLEDVTSMLADAYGRFENDADEAGEPADADDTMPE